MADGNVVELVHGVLGRMERFLDYLFYAGVFYGARNFARLVFRACGGIRTYFGRASDEDICQKYGKWAVITGGTTGIGLAYAHEVRTPCRDFAKKEVWLLKGACIWEEIPHSQYSSGDSAFYRSKLLDMDAFNLGGSVGLITVRLKVRAWCMPQMPCSGAHNRDDRAWCMPQQWGLRKTLEMTQLVVCLQCRLPPLVCQKEDECCPNRPVL
jgi:hypothetical protein